GRTVLISSHLLSEVQQSVDRVIIISRGRLVYEGALEDLSGEARVSIDAPNRDALRIVLTREAIDFTTTEHGFSVTGRSAEQLGELARAEGVALSRLNAEATELEASFLSIVGGDRPGGNGVGGDAAGGSATSEGSDQ